MERTPIISSQINSIGYDEETETLEVEFLNDSSIWTYHPVPKTTYQALMAADSIGAYFYANIRKDSSITAIRAR